MESSTKGERQEQAAGYCYQLHVTIGVALTVSLCAIKEAVISTNHPQSYAVAEPLLQVTDKRSFIA
jgi:hypothetical protein